MGLSHSPKIVKDGLVLCLDAANSKSYPGSGTAWTDLSGNGNNGTLVNSPTYSNDNLGSVSFDGADDYIIVQPNGPSNSDYFTITGWFKTPGSGKIYEQIFISNYASTNFPEVVEVTVFSTNKLRFYTRKVTPNAADLSSISNVTDNNWKYFTCVRNNNIYLLYINGSLEVQTSFTQGSIDISQGPITIGNGTPGTNINNRNFTGNISNIQIYNRALSQEEITQNFNALRGRYGI